MSTRDLIAFWEEGLALAFRQPDDIDLDDTELEDVADRRIGSNVRAGDVGTFFSGTLHYKTHCALT